MQSFTFNTYKAKEKRPPADQILWQLPDEWAGSRRELAKQAGLSTKEIPEAGVLTAPWEGHPQDAVILAPTVDFEAGAVFAISREPLQAKA